LALQGSLAAVLANRKLLSEANTLNPRIAREKYSEAQYVCGVDGIIGEFCRVASR
jgi:hypothetical protein